MTKGDGDEMVAGGERKPDPAAPRESGAVVGRPGAEGGDIHSYIGARLRKEYNDIAQQPVPDRFLELMRQLDQQS